MVGRARDIVKDEEPHRSIADGVVTRRTRKRIGITPLTVHYGPHCIHGTACSIESCIKRASTEWRIALYFTPITFHRAPFDMSPPTADIIASVIHSEFILGPRPRSYRVHLAS